MGEFVQAKLISDKANFWDPLKKTTSKPFFPIKPSKGKQALKRINLDRQVYSRLLVVSKDRDSYLGIVQSYELASAPLALANMDGSLRKPTTSTLRKLPKELKMGSFVKSTVPAYSLHQLNSVHS